MGSSRALRRKRPWRGTDEDKVDSTLHKLRCQCGQSIHQVDASTPDMLAAAFAQMQGERVEALSVLTDPTFITHRRAIVELAASKRLPAIYGDREFVEAGGLMFYGASLIDMYRRAADVG